MERITIADKVFRKEVSDRDIEAAVSGIAARMNADFAGRRLVFLGVLNGSFMFVAELMKRVNLECELAFVKLASYHGAASSSGTVKELVGLDCQIRDRLVVVLEDIVDTGNTIDSLLATLRSRAPAEIRLATLLFKRPAYTKEHALDYVAFEIPDRFIVGFGLDYRGMGRNLPHLYTEEAKSTP